MSWIVGPERISGPLSTPHGPLAQGSIARPMSPLQTVAVLVAILMLVPQGELALAFAHPTPAKSANVGQILASSPAPPIATPTSAQNEPTLLSKTNTPFHRTSVTRASSTPVAPNPSLSTTEPSSPDRLSVSTYLGGAGSELTRDFASYPNLDATVDSDGNIYLVGGTSSPKFPTTADALSRQLAGQSDIFLVKLDPTGQHVLYATLLGGSGAESAAAVVVGGDKGIYLAGTTTSPDFFASSHSNGLRGESNPDAFVLKLDPTGRTLVWATCLGGSASDSARDLAVDQTGSATVIGLTASSDLRTTTGAFQPAWAGGMEAFAARLSASGSSLAYSTYLGGAGDDRALGLWLDDDGAAYIAGRTESYNFPTTAGAYRTTLEGRADAFVARLSSNGANLQASTLLGGEGEDLAGGLARDQLGRIAVAGASTVGP